MYEESWAHLNSDGGQHCRRGRFDIAFFEDRLLIDSPKQTIHVPYTAISSVIILDRIPKDTKGRVLLCLHLDKCAPEPICQHAEVAYAPGCTTDTPLASVRESR